MARPQITRIQAQSDGTIRLTLGGQAGSRYAVEVSTDLYSWNEIATLENQTGTVDFTENPADGVKSPVL